MSGTVTKTASASRQLIKSKSTLAPIIKKAEENIKNKENEDKETNNIVTKENDIESGSEIDNSYDESEVVSVHYRHFYIPYT